VAGFGPPFFMAFLTKFRYNRHIMIRKIKIENFYSFRDEVELDFGIPLTATDLDDRFAQSREMDRERLPKVLALYGPNASGKTNFLRAVSFLVDFAANSVHLPIRDQIRALPFRDVHHENETTKFLVELDGKLLDWPDRAVFSYELHIMIKTKTVVFEALKYKKEKNWRGLFTRNGQQIDSKKDFQLTKNDRLKQNIRKDASVISCLALLNHPFAAAIQSGLQHLMTNVSVSGKHEFLPRNATDYYQKNPEVFSALQVEIGKLDLGIDRIELISTNNGIEPFFTHSGLDKPLPLLFESNGTKRFYAQFPTIEYALRNGGVAILDEIDSDIHPTLLPELVKKFQSPHTNPFNAQLIMSCHDASLLDYLEKEEILIVEKDSIGGSDIYRLTDIKGIRRDKNLYANYLSGVYGGIPRVA
jgi:uncharacterized protein